MRWISISSYGDGKFPPAIWESFWRRSSKRCGPNPWAPEGDIRLVIPRVPWPLSTVMADEDLLGSAFFNLIDNALKYTRRQDAVEIRAAERDRLIQVEIADSGPGIPPEELPRIFEELYRGSNAHESDGSGLGLALVKRIIERHGGTISVHSRMDGATGSIFTVLLPTSGAGEHITKR